MITALATTAFAWVIFGVLFVGWILYAIFNVRGGKREVGSEIELAANRKKYYDDETLEGPKLERTQLLAVLFLVVSVIALPLYWVFEPQRLDNASYGWDKRFASWGSDLFAPTAEGGFNCAGCHGGMQGAGNEADYTVTDKRTGEVEAVKWKAPALNTVLYRFSEAEVRFILVYGRPFSPMSPWGIDGGGPMNDQQIDTLIEYLKSIQLTPESCAGDVNFPGDKADPAICDGGVLPASEAEAVEKSARDAMAAAAAAGTPISYGEALFNNSLASGAYSCARCHTDGWSYGQQASTGIGGIGPNLTGGSTNTKFTTEAEMIDFIKSGSQNGKKYGSQGQGSGKMPAFGHMLTDEQIKAIVEYVRSL